LYITLASLEGQRGNLEKALELVELAVNRDPGNPEPSIHRALILSRLGRSEEVAQVLDAAITKFPTNPRIEVSYARLVDLPRGQMKAAEDRVRQAVERDPFLTNGWLVLGQILERTSRVGEAVEAYRSGLARQTDDVDLHAALGHALARLGERP